VRVDLETLLEPATTVVLTQECQRGVVGAHSALPELAAVARESGMLTAVGRLVQGARVAGATVLHAVAARRADGKGASRNARLFRAAEHLPVRQLLGSPAVEIAEEIGMESSDLVSVRLHGLSPLAGTDADALLRNLGCRTLVIVGVSANVAIPNAVFDAVNLGYQVVLPRDGIAGVPPGYTDTLIANSLSLLATITTTDEILSCWKRPDLGPPRPE
jgi:nicotinamidase-related amidase